MLPLSRKLPKLATLLIIKRNFFKESDVLLWLTCRRFPCLWFVVVVAQTSGVIFDANYSKLSDDFWRMETRALAANSRILKIELPQQSFKGERNSWSWNKKEFTNLSQQQHLHRVFCQYLIPNDNIILYFSTFLRICLKSWQHWQSVLDTCLEWASC